MGEKSALFNKGPLTKGQNPVSQPEKTNSSRSNNPSINRILHFQKAIGNKDVQGLICTYILQAKLKIGKPKDKYEQEADRVAEKVMIMPMPGVDQISSRQGREGEKHTPKKPFFQTISLLLKKKEEDEEKVQPTFMLQRKAEEDDEIQTKPLILREELEGEEEEKARTKFFIQRQDEEEKEEEEEVQTKPLIQEQQEEAEEEEEEEEEEVQAKELPGYIPEIPPNIETDINNMRGGGQPLSVNTRAFFEPRFGYDFSPVKVHTDSRAASASESINARAFSIGHNIFFGEGQYKPEKTEGRHLIAHELTHVVQQGGGRALNKAEIINRWYSHLNKSEHFLVQKEDDEKERGQSEWLHKKLGTLNIDRVNDSKVVQGGFLDWVTEKGSAAVKGVKKLGSKIKKGITAAVSPLIEKAKGYIADKVKNVPGYELATYILGKDPITQKKVSKKSGGFLKLIFKLLGAEETYDKLVKSKVVNKAYGLLANALQRAKLTWEFIVKSIKVIWDFLTKNPWGLITALGMAKDFFFSLVSKTIQVGKSVLTKIPLLVLEGFLTLVGAPVKKIMGIINKGKDVILYIANDPLKFVGHLVGALKKGFFQFRDNIWKHLKAGLLGWLFGTLQKAGITMPERFDLKGIFSLVMQILGITYARIREKVVKVIGEKNMQRLEKAWEFIKALVTGGIGALWEKVKESLGSLKDMVIGAIKNWVVTKIVASAISKLASMFNPVGAIIQAALTIYNTIMFFIERAKQIAALVEAVFNSITDIAYGKITAAANFVEKSMANTLPIIISFLARLIGFGGISHTIKKIIMKLQKKVDMAIDKAIDWIVKKARGLLAKGKQTLAKIAHWWGLFKEFKGGDGKEHKLFFEGNEANSVLMIASKKTTFSEFITQLEVSNNEDMKAAQSSAIDIAKKIDDIKGEKIPKGTKEEEKAAKQNKTDRINEQLEELRKYAPILFGTINPSAEPNYMSGNPFSLGTKITSLTVIPPPKNGPGTEPQDTHPVYDILNQRRVGKKGASYYVRGHLLNQNLHGHGKWYNMTPLSQSGNRKHEIEVESKVKAAVDSGATVEYEVIPNYDNQPNKEKLIKEINENDGELDARAIVKKDIVRAEDKVPLSLKCSAKTVKGSKIEWNLGSVDVGNPVERKYESYQLGKSLPPSEIKVNKDDARSFQYLPGIGEKLAKAIVAYRKNEKDKNPNLKQVFKKVNDLENVTGIGPMTIEKINKKVEEKTLKLDFNV